MAQKEVLKLLKEGPLSVPEIVFKTKYPYGKVKKALEKLEESGKVEREAVQRKGKPEGPEEPFLLVFKAVSPRKRPNRR
jgi:predicted transcriptional regulator